MLIWSLCCFSLVFTSHTAFGLTSPSCDAITWVSREEWGSRYPIGGGNLSLPVDYVFIHHTDMPPENTTIGCIAMVQYIQEYHVIHNGWDDIGYNFLVCGDGRVYVGRDWNHVGAQTYNWNSKSLGFSLIGTYHDVLPSDIILSTTEMLIQCGIELNAIKSDIYGLYGHRDGSCTTCPGNTLYSELSNWSHWHLTWPIEQYCANDTYTN
ncbi:peptidoglycan recognition protein 1 [Chamberlinius hualienensis]